MKQITLTVILLLVGFSVFSEEPAKIAVLEFQNDTGKTRIWNGWDLQRDLTRELERTKKFKPIRIDDVENISDQGEWLDGRLPLSVEKQFKEIGVRYVFYGTVKQWEVSLDISAPREPAASTGYRTPTAVVSFAITVVDLQTGETISKLDASAFALDAVAQDEPDITLIDERDYRDTFEDASRKACRTAVSQFMEEFGL